MILVVPVVVVDDRPARAPAAADGAVRRPRRRASPHPHRAGRRRRRRDRRRRRRARHRQRQRRARRTRRPTSRRRQMGTGFVSWGPEVLPGEEAPDADERVGAHRGGGREGRARRRGRRAARAQRVLRPRRLHRPRPSRCRRRSTSSSARLDVYGPMVAVADDSRPGLVARPGHGRGRRRRPGRRARGRSSPAPDETAADVTGCARDVWREGTDEAEVDARRARSPATLVAWDGERLGPAPTGAVLPTAARRGPRARGRHRRSLRLTGDIDPPTPRPGSTSWSEGAVDGTYVYVERGYQRPPEAVDRPAGPRRARRRADARRHPDRDLPRPLRRPPRPGHAGRRRRRSTDAAAGRGGVRPRRRLRRRGARGRGRASSPASRSRGRSRSSGDARPTRPEAVGTRVYLAIPWLLIVAIVLALPLLTAAVVGLTARSRLPLVARLD